MGFAFAPLGPTLHWLALVFIFAFLLIGLAIVIVLAALPGQIAARRGHPQAEAINICGWVGLPTGFFWVAALVWAYLNPREDIDATGRLADHVARLETAVALIEANSQEAGS